MFPCPTASLELSWEGWCRSTYCHTSCFSQQKPLSSLYSCYPIVQGMDIGFLFSFYRYNNHRKASECRGGLTEQSWGRDTASPRVHMHWKCLSTLTLLSPGLFSLPTLRPVQVLGVKDFLAIYCFLLELGPVHLLSVSQPVSLCLCLSVCLSVCVGI